MENETAERLVETKVVLARFRKQIDGVASKLAYAFNLPQCGIDIEDVTQEAEILVITYAGMMSETSWGNGELARWDKGTESETQALLATHLKKNLAQVISRKLTSEPNVTPYDPLIGSATDEPTSNKGFQPKLVKAIDNRTEQELIAHGFPTFARNTLDNVTQPEIANELGVSLATVERRIAKEKRAYLIDYVQRHGLQIEGDETTEELVEAYQFLLETK